METSIATPRLVLDRLDAADAEAIFRLFRQAAVSEGFGQDRLSDPEQAHYWISVQRWSRAAGSGETWCLRETPGGTVIGTVSFEAINRLWHHADISYALDPAYWGRGLMPEALAGLIAHAFSGGLACPIHRLEALVLPGNPRSTRVLDKLGFVYEGRRRGLVFWQGQYRDVDGYALLSPPR